MTTADGFEINGVRCFQSSDDPSLFFFVPANPGPELDSQNRPTLLMLVSGTGAILQLGSNWKVDPSVLQALRSEAAKRHPEFDAATIRLSAGASSVQKVILSLGDGRGSFDVLQSSSSSGFPPYSAIFNARLTAQQKELAVAALNGRSGFLKIAYFVTVSALASIEVTIAGSVGDDLAKLDSSSTLEDCRHLIEAALMGGRLTRAASEQGPVSAEMRQKAQRLATEKAAGALLQMTRLAKSSPANTDLKVAAKLTDTVMTSEERSTDISSWFPGGTGPDHVKPLPGAGTVAPPVSPPSETDDPVLLGFDVTADLPIAFVEIARAGTKAVLRPPAFEKVTLARVESSDPATVTTAYTDGGPPFKSTLAAPAANGWVLKLEDLGLQKVVVDASARRAAGAREVRVRIRYRPSDQGSDDDRTIYLREDTWTTAFYEVTRSATLAGILEIEWKETGADGSVKNGRSETSDPNLKLT